jgi:hypothetical protein
MSKCSKNFTIYHIRDSVWEKAYFNDAPKKNWNVGFFPARVKFLIKNLSPEIEFIWEVTLNFIRISTSFQILEKEEEKIVSI